MAPSEGAHRGEPVCPGVAAHIPRLTFSARDGLGVFRLIITGELMRSTAGNGVIKSKADALPAGASRICFYAFRWCKNKARRSLSNEPKRDTKV